MNRVFSELPPLSLYVHIPWCVRKCPYCDFNSHEAKSDIPEQAYVDALLTDLAAEMPSVWGRTVSTVFIGGGTPSLFSGKAIDQLMSGIRALTGLQPNAEVTMEANPGTVEQGRFKQYRESGINRISIGIQSFNDVALQTLGRVHSSDEAKRAVAIAHEAGFEEINLDLMFALPDQTLEDALIDVETGLALDTTHLSCYELTLEPNTLFARFPPPVPDDDLKATMQDAIIDKLAIAGFERYEISAYARHHNVNYWQFGDYLGIGAGAHGKISSAQSGDIVRRWKHKHPKRYLEASTHVERVGDETIIPVADTGLEFMMNALRLVDGFPLPLFQKHTGVSLLSWQKTIDAAYEKGLVEHTGTVLKPTKMGLNWLNTTLEMFMEDAAEVTTKRYPVIPLNIKNPPS